MNPQQRKLLPISKDKAAFCATFDFLFFYQRLLYARLSLL